MITFEPCTSAITTITARGSYTNCSRRGLVVTAALYVSRTICKQAKSVQNVKQLARDPSSIQGQQRGDLTYAVTKPGRCGGANIDTLAVDLLLITSLAMVVTPSARPAYLPGSVCKRVFTTSSGMTVRCVDVQPTAPHAAKSSKSIAVRLRSCAKCPKGCKQLVPSTCDSAMRD